MPGGRERRDGNGTGTHLHRRVREGPRCRRSRRVKWRDRRGTLSELSERVRPRDGRDAVTDLATPMTGTSAADLARGQQRPRGVSDERPPAHRDAAARRGVNARGTRVMRCVRPPARPSRAIDVEIAPRTCRRADECVNASPPLRPVPAPAISPLTFARRSRPISAGSTSRARRTPAGARPSTPRSARAPPSPSSPPRTRRYARSRRGS